MTGWWFQPLWKIWKSVGIIIPNIWKHKSHVPNHQPNDNKLWDSGVPMGAQSGETDLGVKNPELPFCSSHQGTSSDLIYIYIYNCIYICITLHYISLHYITLHWITLHYITLNYVTLHYITLNYVTLHYITLNYFTLQYVTLHYITLNYVILHYITLHYITLHRSHYIALHNITYHYIPLHKIT